MNILFLTISRLTDVSEHNIYNDLMRKFRDEGHEVYIVSPRERRYGEKSSLTKNNGVNILGVRTLNLIKTNVIEKGLGQVLLEYQFKKAIKKFLKGVSFDLVIYSTPPITFTGVVRYMKKKQPKSVSYLMLKDIFPQNAVDLGMFGEKSFFYKYFRNKEEQLYKTSDYIGCMSPANVEFLLKHNGYLKRDRIEICPNAVELDTNNKPITEEERSTIRKEYNIPTDVPVFLYGGSLGKPQGVDYIVDCLKVVASKKECYFLIVGAGVEQYKIKDWIVQNNPSNIRLLDYMDKEDYDRLVKACDIGLIFLDYRFTIPNFPSRLLSYLEQMMPVISATDMASDVGVLAEANQFGMRVPSNDVEAFVKAVENYIEHPEIIKQQGENGYQFLLDNYQVGHCYSTIMKHFEK